jgi:hypothetical protein
LEEAAKYFLPVFAIIYSFFDLPQIGAVAGGKAQRSSTK